MSAAVSTALSPAHRPALARRLVVFLLTALVAAGLLAVPASATMPVTTTTTTAPTATRLRTPANRTVYARRTTTLRSKLVTSSGQPVAGRRVQLLVRYPGREWHYARSATTSRYGTVAFRVQLRTTRYVKVRFTGDSTYAASVSRAGKVTVRSRGAAAVKEAARHRGKPYGYGASGPRRFDCSGFTSYVYRRFGTSLPHSSRAQRSRTRRIARSSRRPGDLVFFHGTNGVYHVAIYAGNGYMWDSPRPGKRVSRRPIYSSRVSYGRV